MIHGDGVPLIVGCTHTQACDSVKPMASSAALYAAARQRGRMVRMVGDLHASTADQAALRAFALRQDLPSGLGYVTGSGNPTPEIDASASGTRLRWEWAEHEAVGAHTVTYGVAPLAEGLWALGGQLEFSDAAAMTRTLPLPTRVITVAGECLTPTTQMTAPAAGTPTTPPTAVPTAVPTGTPPGEPTAAATGTPGHEPTGGVTSVPSPDGTRAATLTPTASRRTVTPIVSGRVYLPFALHAAVVRDDDARAHSAVWNRGFERFTGGGQREPRPPTGRG